MTISRKKFVIAGPLIALLGLLPLIASAGYVLNIISMLFLYITISQSWNILGGYTGQINVGQAAFFGVGALSMRLLWTWGFPFYIALVAGGALSAVLAVAIGYPTLRLRGHYFAVGTLALAWIAYITVGNLLPGVSVLSGKHIATYDLMPRYYICLIILLATLATTYLVVNSKAGLAIEAIRDDEEAAAATGVNPFKYKVIAFTISSFFTGLAGGSFAFLHVSYYWDIPFGLMWCFEPILITFIGGAGTLMGPVIGSIFYIALKEAFVLTMGEINVLIFGIIFILIILFFPGGIIGIPAKIRRLK